MHVDSIVKNAAKRVSVSARYCIPQCVRLIAGGEGGRLGGVHDVSVVRPVLEYACPVWHTNLPKYLCDNIEIIQKRALESIFPNKG